MIISKINPKIDLNFILHKNEDIYFERKWVFNQNWEVNLKTVKILEEIIWMLNAEGGILVLWVNNWQIEDLKNLSNVKFQDFLQIALEITPTPNIEIEEVEIDWKTILIYHIPIEKNKIFSKKDGEAVFLRSWDENRELNREQVKFLEYNKDIRIFEDEVVKNFLEEDFDEKTINLYLKIVRKEWEDFREVFRSRWLCVKEDWKYFYKNSCILLFSKNPSIYIPSASLRYVRINWNELKSGSEFNVIKDERFETNIPTLIEQIKIFMNWALKDFYYFDINIWKFKKVVEYPKDAWLEWIVNALTHRSYNLQWNITTITHFDNKLEISNSWPLPTGITVENIRNERFSRNPYIARILYEFGYVREFNEWTKRIFKSMEEIFFPTPIYLNNSNVVKLTLQNNTAYNESAISEETMRKIEKIFNNLNDYQQKVLNTIVLYKRLTFDELLEITKISEKTLRSHIKFFIEENIFIKDGWKRDKNATYLLKK